MKVVNLEKYKSKLELRKRINSLEEINKEYYDTLSPIEQKGYHNFMRLLKAIDAQPESDEDGGG